MLETQKLTLPEIIRQLREKGACFGQVNPTEYHSFKPLLEEEFGCPVVSKSALADFMASPYRYKYSLDNGIRKTSEGLALGSLVDCLVLTPELFNEQYLCEPVRVQLKKDGTPYADGRQDPAQREEWAAKAEQGITALSEEQLARGKGIADLANESLSYEGLTLGDTFVSQVGMWVYLTELGGQKLACPVVVTGMLDICPTEDGSTKLWDLKTTSSDVGNPTKLSYAMEDFHYGMQAALYTDLWQLCSGEPEPRSFSFMFVGTVPPLMTRAVHMGDETLELYRAEYQNAVHDYCIAWHLNEWGNPQQDDIFFSPSPREYKRIADLQV